MDDKTTPEPKPAADPKPADKTEPAKLTLTEEELEQRINARLADVQRKADAKAAKEKADAERKAAEEQGKHKELADAEKARADAAEAKVRGLTIAGTVRDTLAEKHPEHANAAKYIVPLVPSDTSDDDLAKVVAGLCEQYAKDNPRQAVKQGAGAPPSGGNRTAPARPNVAPAADRGTPRFRSLTYRG